MTNSFDLIVLSLVGSVFFVALQCRKTKADPLARAITHCPVAIGYFGTNTNCWRLWLLSHTQIQASHVTFHLLYNKSHVI